jgi:hypothetical protein
LGIEKIKGGKVGGEIDRKMTEGEDRGRDEVSCGS